MDKPQPSGKTRVAITIPAYNEGPAIGQVVRSLRQALEPEAYDFTIVVVDDGSADATAAIAEQAGADIVIRQPNRGKGAALRAGGRLAQVHPQQGLRGLFRKMNFRPLNNCYKLV